MAASTAAERQPLLAGGLAPGDRGASAPGDSERASRRSSAVGGGAGGDGTGGGHSALDGAAAGGRASLMEQRAALIKDASTEIRSGFIRKVYSILSVQMVITTLVAVPIMRLGPEGIRPLMWVPIASMCVLVVTMLLLLCFQDALRKFPQNYIILLVITVAMGGTVGFVSAMYTPQSVVLAAGITAGIFLCMTVYAWTTGTDFTGYGPYLMGAMFTLCAFGLVLSIMTLFGLKIKWLVILYDVFGVLLFTMFIVFDTQRIMGGRSVQLSIDDYCAGALTLYMDVINLFLHILSLLGERR